MSARDDLLASDTVMISSFSATLHALGSSYPLSETNMCITKTVGGLQLDLRISAVPGLVIHADGAFEGDAVVVFKVDHDLDVAYQGHKITHVEGAIKMGVLAKAASAGTACGGGAPRKFTVELRAMPAQSKLTLSVPVFIVTAHPTVEDIAVVGSAGIP